MAHELLTYGPTVLAWAAVAYRLPVVWHGSGDPPRRFYWLTLLFLALALTVLLPPVYLASDRLAGVPNLARLLAHGLVLATGWAVQAFLLQLNYPDGSAWRRVRWLGWLTAGALAVMAVLFALAPVDDDSLEFMTRYADAPFMLEYWLVFLASLGLALSNVVRLSWRYADLTDRVALRLGLRVSAAGGVAGLGYVAHEGFYATARRLGLGYPLGDKEMLTSVLVAVATSLMIIGSTMPAWGPRVGIPALYRWVGRYRAYRRLYPLWRALVEATPEIALLPPSSAPMDALTVRDLGFRLYRRVVEIRDGRLALRPYLDPALAEDARTRCRAAGVPTEAAEAVVEAACLAAALQAKRRGQPANPTPPPLRTLGGADLSTEAAMLERVARCYRRSLIVRAVLARPKHPDGTGTDPVIEMAGRP